MRKGTTAAIAVTLLGIALPGSAWAWGASGHGMISRVAMQALPDEIPGFLKTASVIADIGEIAREPDRSRGSGMPHDPDLDPAHFVDLSDDLTAGGIALAALPPTRAAYAAMLRANGNDDYKIGYLPYAIEEGWQQLVKDFAYWRIDVAAQKLAVSAADTAWLKRDQHLREMLIVRDLGFWSHFVGDASQPMHVSVHYDGWGNYPNPNNYPDQHGLHGKFEGSFVNANIQEADLRPLIPAYRPGSGAIRDQTIAYLLATHEKIVPLYELAKTSPFDSPNQAEKAFVIERLAAGTTELRNLTADAWHASADATGGFPPVPVQAAESGKVPVQAILGALRGTD